VRFRDEGHAPAEDRRRGRSLGSAGEEEAAEGGGVGEEEGGEGEAEGEAEEGEEEGEVGGGAGGEEAGEGGEGHLADVFGGEEDAEEDLGVVVVVVVVVVAAVEGSCNAQRWRAGDESVDDGEEHRQLEHVVEEGGRDEEDYQFLSAGSSEKIGVGLVCIAIFGATGATADGRNKLFRFIICCIIRAE